VVDYEGTEELSAPNQDLFDAISAQDTALVQQLLTDTYTDASLLDSLHNYACHSALHHAVEVDNVEIVEMLLDHGMSPVVYDGNSIMHTAVESESYQVLEYLLQHEIVEADQPEVQGMTPCDLAVSYGDIQAVALFKKYDAIET
jgi:ankyrin repeat protein